MAARTASASLQAERNPASVGGSSVEQMPLAFVQGKKRQGAKSGKLRRPPER